VPRPHGDGAYAPRVDDNVIERAEIVGEATGAPLQTPSESDPLTLTWELIAQRSGPAGYLTLHTNTYRQPDGSVADWDILAESDTVAILALTRDGRVVLARQYRPGPNRILDELPGGGIDPEESLITAAARELLEETG